jgi:ribonuclease HII
MHVVIGIDEVGRGSLAGPVVVAATVVPVRHAFPRALGKLRDSKRLSPAKRKEWFSYLRRQCHLQFAVARTYERTIDRVNISQAANGTALRAFERLLAVLPKNTVIDRVVLDGGLYLGSQNGRQRMKTVDPSSFKRGQFFVQTIVRADEKVQSVMLASIVAKVTRDCYMVRVAKRFPAYQFEVHKGYGTATHTRALRRHGITPIHRLTFVKKYPTLNREAYGRRSHKTPHKRQSRP